MKKLNKKQDGFTIIEVLIVLAIAGLIMLIVFLAVPALQRNQRNNARQADANNVVSAVNECITNRNGVINSCKTIAVGGNAVVEPPNRNQLVDVPTYAATEGTQTRADWFFGVTCSDDGLTTGGGTPRQFVVRYHAETATGTTPRCISS